MTILVNISDSTKLKVAENIKEQLEPEGIIINIINSGDKYYEMLDAREYDIALCSVNLGISPSLEMFYGEGNLANYINSEVTNLMNEAKNTVDEIKLMEIYKNLNEIYIEDVPYISLYNQKQVVVYNKALVGEFKPTWYNSYYKIESWYK